MVDIQCAAAEIKRGKEIEDRKKPYCLWNRADHYIFFRKYNGLPCSFTYLLIYFGDQFVASEIRHRRRHCSVCQHEQST